MRLDSQLAFVPLGSPLSFTGGTGAAFPSSVIDLLGLGVGVAPTQVIWGNSSVFGMDPGIGTNRPELEVAIGTAAATSNSATLNIQFQSAVDSGSGGSYLPGTWNTVVETGYLTAANLTANQVVARFPWLPEFPANTRPRYLRLNFQVLAATSFTAGTIAFAIPTFIRDDQANKYQTKNYTVA